MRQFRTLQRRPADGILAKIKSDARSTARIASLEKNQRDNVQQFE
jgi:hypothetical protein